jgi:hypothetical protein
MFKFFKDLEKFAKEEQRQKKFEEMRKKHYDEFIKLQELRSNQYEDEED